MKKCRLSRIVAIAFLVLVAAMTAFYFWLYPPYPSKQDVDKALSAIRTEKSPEKRTWITAEMLDDLRGPRTVEHDGIISDFLHGLQIYYLKTNDQAVLDAIDRFEIDGGYFNDVCGFYYYISKSPGFTARYRKPEHFGGIRRCGGITFSEEELKSMKGAP